MATATVKRLRILGPESAGILMKPREFDRAEFVEGWRYELINGVLVVSSTPLRNERDPNEELGYLLRIYRDTHPQGSALDATLPEETVATGRNRRRADRVIWAGLGRLPTARDKPTIVAEFVSAGKRGHQRDYETKRTEYLAMTVKEYWIFDRFERTLTVFTRQRGKVKKRVFHEQQTYQTDLLPGFELPLARLFSLANRWPSEETPPTA
ncbi:MAG: Uma2 family endonuclease [Gemmataceae bacterium]|nr:Uma2 family endonuclease [Gemmataceae bacterium]